MTEVHHILSAAGVSELLSKEASFLESFPGFSVSFKRYFLSSAAQRTEFPRQDAPASFVVQPPLDGSAVAAWIFLVRDPGVEFLWTAGAVCPEGDSEAQSRRILEEYEASLQRVGLSIQDSCVRTWFFVHDIDRNYAGLVKARRENFETVGLTSSTHYIASTGICGSSPEPGAIVRMDALALRGSFFQRYLYGPTHLNPTCEYGVTFERGVCLEYGGRRHSLISGTASINNRGEVVHVGDVRAQTLRMWENVEVLLAEAGHGWPDVRMMLVYLRNAKDYAAVAPLFAEKFHGVPYVILLAPVCRPDWLIEMECIAF